MKSNWFLNGLRAGVRTEKLRMDAPVPSSLSPGMPKTTTFDSPAIADEIASRCPTAALEAGEASVQVSATRCIDCMRCAYGDPAQEWQHDARWAIPASGHGALPRSFSRSISVRIVDAGDCGACLSELAQMNGPSYNLHQFGIFLTPTPRQADVLLVVGPVTAHMKEPLRTAYESMPEPKRVVAVGACACSGGIFGPSVMCGNGAGDAIPVDLLVPGCPPPPIVIIAALRSVCGDA
jgi:Ni,Fe-hydrogenase III small subunit/ferredoxin-like protein FixX